MRGRRSAWKRTKLALGVTPMRYISRFIAAIRQRGVMTTTGRALNRLIGPRVRVYADRRFDGLHGVDTSGIVDADTLDVSEAYRRTAKRYEPTPVAALRAMLTSIKVDHSQFTFVDFGSGKGRALLLAAQYPYRAVVGVEFSPILNAIAESNIAIWRRRGLVKAAELRTVCTDATEFNLPNGPLVLFFFTPFEASVARLVVDRLRRDHEARPRRILVVYYGGRQDFLAELSLTGFPCREFYSSRPLAAQANYKGYLFTSAQPAPD